LEAGGRLHSSGIRSIEQNIRVEGSTRKEKANQAWLSLLIFRIAESTGQTSYAGSSLLSITNMNSILPPRVLDTCDRFESHRGEIMNNRAAYLALPMIFSPCVNTFDRKDD
jgi:hypothetical protein